MENNLGLSDRRLKIMVMSTMISSKRNKDGFKWASFGDLAEVIGEPNHYRQIARECIKMLWEDGLVTMHFANQDGSGVYWTQDAKDQPNFIAVAGLVMRLRMEMGVPPVGAVYPMDAKLSVDELKSLLAEGLRLMGSKAA